MSAIFNKDHVNQKKQDKESDNIIKLKTTLKEIQTEHANLKVSLGHDLDKDFDITSYEKETRKHIRQLKTYNELKDISMNLIQMIADQKQTTIRKVMDEMGIEDD